MTRALTPEQYQQAAHFFADQAYEYIMANVEQLPREEDGSVDIGPIVQGIMSGLMQAYVQMSSHTEADVRATFLRSIDTLLPQIVDIERGIGEPQGSA